MELQARSLLGDLLTEIDQQDPLILSPRDKRCDHEKVIGTLDDIFLKKLFVFSMLEKREAERLTLESKYEDDKEITKIKAQACQHAWRYDALTKMFWYLVRTKYELFYTDGIGLRTNWEIVDTSNHGEHPLMRSE